MTSHPAHDRLAATPARVGALVAALALAVAGIGPAAATTAPTPAAAIPEGPYRVTLPTGDQVSLTDPDASRVSVRPGPGRAGTPFAVVRSGGRVYVVPADARTRVRAGAADRQQFDVTGLVRARYRGLPAARAAAPAAGTGATHQLTIRYLDRTGRPTQDAFAVLSGWDQNTAEWPVADPDGTSTVQLPEGRYNLGAYVGSGPGTALLVQPVVDLTGDLTVTVDARAAGPVVLGVPEPSARAGLVEAGYSFYPAYQAWPGGMLLTGDDASDVRIGQLGAPAAPDALVGTVAAQWARPDGHGDFADSPYLYAVAQTFPGGVPTGYARDYRAGDFAAVHQRFAATANGDTAQRTVSPAFTPAQAGYSALVVPTTLPATRVEYHQAGMRWSAELFTTQRMLYRQPTAYLPGRLYRDEWNAGPTGPAFAQEGGAAWQWASRTGDRIDVGLPLYGDRAGHAGRLAPTDTSRTALYRDGALVGESALSGAGSFTVPPDPADYRLEVADTRSTDDLTTGLSAAWTFRSGHADGTGPVRLALPAIRFTPALDATGAAPADRVFTVPVSVEGQPGAPAPRTTGLTVDVSYDDGATWSRATVRRVATGWTATVRHPAGARFASLRATATDATGTTVTETIIHAYRLVPA